MYSIRTETGGKNTFKLILFVLPLVCRYMCTFYNMHLCGDQKSQISECTEWPNGMKMYNIYKLQSINIIYAINRSALFTRILSFLSFSNKTKTNLSPKKKIKSVWKIRKYGSRNFRTVLCDSSILIGFCRETGEIGACCYTFLITRRFLNSRKNVNQKTIHLTYKTLTNVIITLYLGKNN